MKKQFYLKLWDSANFITGFAAAQALTFAFLFNKGKAAPHLCDGNNLLIMGIFISLGGLIYILGVYFCLRWAQKLLLTGDTMELNEVDQQNILHTIKYSKWGRIIAIIFFTILDLGVLCVIGMSH